MNEQDKKELMEVVDQDKQHIINYLLTFNLKVKNNEVSLLFSDGEVDESTMDQQSFVNLWKLQYEPSLVRVEFIIQRARELNSNIKDLLESLLNKIVNKGHTNNSYDSLGNSKVVDDYNCYKSIQIERQGVDVKVVLFGAIGYFN
jgi:hypothetical protein